jgi:hypothetical protein
LKRPGSGSGSSRKKFSTAVGNSALIEVLSTGVVLPERLLSHTTAVQSPADVAEELNSKLLVSDALPLIASPVAPWVSLLQYIIPFSDNVFVAGSTGTWLAEMLLHRMRPIWEPSDIDVFIIRTKPYEFEALVNTTVIEMDSWSVDNWPIRFRVFRKHPHMINIHWWISDLKCPTLSFINCIRDDQSSDDILNGFDIDICKVTVNMDAGEMSVKMKTDVRKSILDHVMHCVLKQGSLLSEMQYPMARIIDRIEKYSNRGYRLQSLEFQSAQCGQLRIDPNIQTVSWDVVVMHVPSALVAEPLIPSPGLVTYYEWQSRGSIHSHIRRIDHIVHTVSRDVIGQPPE